MKVVTVKGVALGEGRPKICVPLVGCDIMALHNEIERIREAGADLVEWRGDCYSGILDCELRNEALALIRSGLPEMPILFTFRTIHEGGNRAVTWQEYLRLNRSVLNSGKADLIDVESRGNRKMVCELVSAAKENNVSVIASNHDFERTPAVDEIQKRLEEQYLMGADIGKIAVMPQCRRDVITLLEATEKVSKTSPIPIITMSMASNGLISRMAGEVFGSCITFGSAVEASAPGQIPVVELKQVLDIIHRHL